MRVKSVYELRLKARSPLIVGGRTEEVRYHGASSQEGEKWIIPASAIKGAFTEHLKNNVDHLGKDLVKKLCGEEGDGRTNEGSIKFSDLNVVKNITVEKSHVIRTRISISRLSGSIQPGALAVFKCVKPGTEFKGLLLLGDKLSDDEEKAFFEFLKKENQFFIGKNQTVGMGRVEIELAEMKEEMRELYKELAPGMYVVTFEPLSPFSSTEVGFETLEKKYFISSKNYVPSSAMKKVLDLKRTTHFYPSNSIGGISVPMPSTYLRPKYRDDTIYDCLIELVKSRLEKKAFLMCKDSERLVEARGYKLLTRDRTIKTKEVVNFHIKLNEYSKNVAESFWVQKSYKPDYWVGFVYHDEPFRLPKYIIVGGARSKGYGLMKLKDCSKYVPSNWKNSIERFSETLRKILKKPESIYVPFLLTTHYFCLDPKEDFHGNVIESFASTDYFRLYDPSDELLDGKRVKILETVGPGSVVIVEYERTLEEVLKMLEEMKKKGIGAYTELGLGDFEVYPINE